MVLERDASASRLHLVNTVLACRRYYLDGASKSEIAGELGISRFKVARMLDRARRDGIVRIEIDPLPELDLDLGDALARRHGIRGAVVVRSSGASDELRLAQLGRAAAAVLGDILEASDVLGISWGRTLHALVGQLPRLPACAVVQLVGSVPTLQLEVNSIELVRRLAERATGPVFPLHVPLLVGSAEMADALTTDSMAAATLDRFDSLTRAVVGIGAWAPGASSIRAALSDADARATDQAGGIADIASIVLDSDGVQVRAAGLPERCIAIREEQLRRVPDVIAIAGGADKVPAIRAALRSGLIHRLITDEEAARLLVAD
ncbi:MAG TPA: sugar-binding domain-containing protein [Candidatus Limnocylindrales bacterium]|nr:sugar-binding domain-containing protein [Candidatus Limnocylindrales bacterium]